MPRGFEFAGSEQKCRMYQVVRVPRTRSLKRRPRIPSLTPYKARFLSDSIIIRVPFFLVFGFNTETPKYKGQRVLLRNL